MHRLEGLEAACAGASVCGHHWRQVQQGFAEERCLCTLPPHTDRLMPPRAATPASPAAEVRQPLADAAGAEVMLHRAFLAADEAISAEEGCTATAVLMWRDGQGDVCLQARRAHCF